MMAMDGTELKRLAVNPRVVEECRGLATPLPKYSGFPWWYALITPPGQEEASARRLQRLDVFAYLPTYTRPVKLRGRMRRAKLLPVITGMLFVPVEMLDVTRRDEVFDLCRIADYIRAANGHPARISKAAIERIREIEALLNLDLVERATNFRVRQPVRLKNDLMSAWGQGRVSAIDKRGRITIEFPSLFGRSTSVTVPASEIEAM